VRRGLTLVEVIVSLAILAMGLLFVLSLIPSSVLSLKKAEDLQAASAYGMELLEMVRLQPPSAEERQAFDVDFNHTSFHFVREIYSVEEGLFDVVVVAQGREDTPPLRLATRVHAMLGGDE
jgi:prepilin-type N-terminal cleavage/methylation domain-containing protein